MPPLPRSRRPAALALLGALALAACGGESPGRVVRLFDRRERAVWNGRPPAPPDLLGRPADGDEAWRPAVRLQREPTAEERAAFATDAAVLGPRAAEVGAVTGSWVRVVPAEPETSYGLVATVRVSSAGGVARVGLAELPSLPASEAPLAELAAAARIHWSAVLPGPSAPLDVALLARTAPDTRALAVVLAHRVVEGAEGAAEAGVLFEDLRLSRATAADRAAALAGDASLARADSGPLAGRFEIARSRREGFAVPPGTEVRVPVQVPADAERLRAALGLVPHEDFPAGREVRFRLELVSGEERRELGEWTRTTAGARDSRWEPVELAVPSALRGRRATLVARTDASDPATPCLPVLATPRLVPREPARRGPNVVVVSLDTLRADRVGAYGCERDTTPHLDRLAEEAWVFEDAWTQGPYTLPAHMSLFTGQHPSVHGVQSEGDGRDPGRSPLLAELLRARGYATAAFTGGGYVHPSFGFDAGFETYGTLDLAWNRESPRLVEFMERIPDVGLELANEASMERVESWIGEHAEESFLLFFHTYAAHEFDPPAADLAALGLEPRVLSDDPGSLLHLGLAEGTPERPLPPEDAERLLALYDGAVRQADRALGRVVDALRAEGILDETILVVLSDHGKEIGDHGQVGHGHTLYEELLRVPLVVRWPGGEPRRERRPAMLVDVVPTVLSTLGLDSPAPLQGRDLRALPESRELFAEVDNLAVKAALRRGPLKTIWGPLDAEALFPNEREEESYDLASDPRELRPLEPDAARVAAVRAVREALRALALRHASGAARAGRVSGSLASELEALGYQDR